MKNVRYVFVVSAFAVIATASYSFGDPLRIVGQRQVFAASEEQTPAAPDKAAVDRSRKTVKSLDNIFKQTIVLITEKYVHDEDDFAAGSAAVLLFKNISESGDQKVRLIDATGDSYEPANVARDSFEEQGVIQLKAGAAGYEQVVSEGGKFVLRSLTPVPVVSKKCIMCHPHYESVEKGRPIGAISYTVPIE